MRSSVATLRGTAVPSDALLRPGSTPVTHGSSPSSPSPAPSWCSPTPAPSPASSPTCATSPRPTSPLVIGVYAFKYAGLDADGVRESLKTFFWLAIIDLQVIAGRNLGGQVTFITTLTYLFLAGAAVLYVAVLARRASPRLLAYAVPVLMLFPLAWEVVVDFRFSTSCWKSYHF